MILRCARLQSRLVDIAVRDSRIESITSPDEIERATDDVDLSGRAVLPGLRDAHLHFWSWAGADQTVDVSTARTPTEVAHLLRGRTDAVIRGSGLEIGFLGEVPTAELLDEACGSTPTLLVSRDWHAVWINTAAAAKAPQPTGGVLFEDDAWSVLQAWSTVGRESDAQIAVRGLDALVRRGITEIDDFELEDGWGRWTRHLASHGPLPLRVRSAVMARDLPAAVDAGRRTGEGEQQLLTGPVKVFADGSLGSQTAWCHKAYGAHGAGMAGCHGPELDDVLLKAQRNHFEIAVHAIGDVANREVLDAFERTGAAGRIEHCQLLFDEDVPRFAALGITASVQPTHALDDQELLGRYWSDRRPRAYRFADLVASGASVVFGSDAPVTAPDPWLAMAIASGHVEVPGVEPIPWATALAASTLASIEPGGTADLVVLDSDPWATPPQSWEAAAVVATLVAGEWAYNALEGSASG